MGDSSHYKFYDIREQLRLCYDLVWKVKLVDLIFLGSRRLWQVMAKMLFIFFFKKLKLV